MALSHNHFFNPGKVELHEFPADHWKYFLRVQTSIPRAFAIFWAFTSEEIPLAFQTDQRQRENFIPFAFGNVRLFRPPFVVDHADLTPVSARLQKRIPHIRTDCFDWVLPEKYHF